MAHVSHLSLRYITWYNLLCHRQTTCIFSYHFVYHSSTFAIHVGHFWPGEYFHRWSRPLPVTFCIQVQQTFPFHLALDLHLNNENDNCKNILSIISVTCINAYGSIMIDIIAIDILFSNILKNLTCSDRRYIKSSILQISHIFSVLHIQVLSNFPSSRSNSSTNFYLFRSFWPSYQSCLSDMFSTWPCGIYIFLRNL